MANPENKQIPYESTQKDIRDAIESVATAIGGIAIPSADHVSYDNSVSGLSATDVQNALDEIVSDIPTVNDGTLTIQQNGETKGTFTANQSENSTVNIEIPTTDIQTAVDEFETYNGGILDSLKVALTPIQDLHGYDHPWVGGAGKNKLPLVLADIKAINTDGTWNDNVYTINGGTITVNTDDDGNVISIKANGTFNNTTIFYLIDYSKWLNPSTSYYLNGITTGSQNTYKLDVTTAQAPIATSITGDSEMFSVDNSTDYRCRFVVYSGVTLSNITYSPMVRISTESPTFESYSNICPITGHTEVELDVLPDDSYKPYFEGVVKGTYGFVDLGTLDWNYRDLYNHAFSTTGIQSLSKTYGDYDVANGIVGIYSAVSQNVMLQNQINSTFSINLYGVLWVRNTNYSDAAAFKTAMSGVYLVYELATPTIPSYTPAEYDALVKSFNGKTIVTPLGQTIYMANIDMVSGGADKLDAFYEYDGTESGWTTRTTAGGLRLFERIMTPTPLYNQPTPQMGMCNELIWNLNLTTEYSYRIYGGTLSIKVADNITSLADFYTWLGDNPLQIEYPIANPQHIQLSPTIVKALVGENYLSAPLDGQEIVESKYKKMFTFDDVIAYIQSLS